MINHDPPVPWWKTPNTSRNQPGMPGDASRCHESYEPKVGTCHTHQCSLVSTSCPEKNQGHDLETFCKNLQSTIWDRRSLMFDPCSKIVSFWQSNSQQARAASLPMLQAPAPAVRFSSDMSLVFTRRWRLVRPSLCSAARNGRNSHPFRRETTPPGVPGRSVVPLSNGSAK